MLPAAVSWRPSVPETARSSCGRSIVSCSVSSHGPRCARPSDTYPAKTRYPSASGRRLPSAGMEEARAVLERLERIERLRREGALPDVLLDELRALLAEAEEWSSVEGGDVGERAVAGLRHALAHDMIGV